MTAETSSRSPGAAWLAAACGAALVVFAAYALTGPGRIDMIDGQMRYEVGVRWLEEGRPVVKDGALMFTAVTGKDGSKHSRYGLGGTVTALPLLALIPPEADPLEEVRRFVFPLSSALGAAAVCGFLLLLLRRMGVGLRPALGWTAAAAFATLMWPVGASTFPHAQPAALLVGGLLLALASAQQGRPALAAAGGALASLSITFDEYLLVLLPWLALATLQEGLKDGQAPGGRVRGFVAESLAVLFFRRPERRAAAVRFWSFCLATLLGVGLYMLTNVWRHGSPLHSGKADNLPDAHAFWTNPLAGLLSLTVSPGKGILWYSPSVLLALAGLRGLWRRAPAVALGIAGASLTLLLMLSPLAFFGGDWCWGPRYLVAVLPLWCVAWPYATGAWARRPVRAAVLGASVLVQVLGLSMEHHNFFYQRNLPAYFWAEQPWFYFQQSALLARPRELLIAWEARGQPRPHFTPGPYRDLVTYCPFGRKPGPGQTPESWMKHFAVFYLPRPWPLWCAADSQGRCPVSPVPAVALFAGVGLLGGLLVRRALREEQPPAVAMGRSTA